MKCVKMTVVKTVVNSIKEQMMITAVGGSPQLAPYTSVVSSTVVSGVRGAMNQQELQGQAAIKLIDSAAVSVSGSTGQNIDVYA